MYRSPVLIPLFKTVEPNGRDRAPKKRKFEGSSSEAKPKAPEGQNKTTRSVKPTVAADNRDAKRQKRDKNEEEEESSEVVQHNQIKPPGETQPQASQENNSANRSTASRREGGTERISSARLQEEARKLKHHADAEYKVVCNLRLLSNIWISNRYFRIQSKLSTIIYRRVSSFWNAPERWRCGQFAATLT